MRNKAGVCGAVGLLFDRGEGIAIMRQGNLIYCLNEYQESSHDREESARKVKEYSTELQKLRNKTYHLDYNN